MKALFKFSPSGNGSAGFFSHGFHKKTNEIVLFVKLVKQTNWDAAKKVGSCRGGVEASCMLGKFEMAGIAEAIDGRTNFKTYHKGAAGQSAITFDHIEGKGFTFKQFKNDVNHLIGLSYAEARLLRLSIDANLQLDSVQWFYRQPGENAAPQGEEAAGYEEN